MIDLKGKEYLLNAILEYCEDIVTVKDLNFNYVAYNRAFLRVMNFDNETAKSITNSHITKVLKGDSCVDIIMENSKRVIETLETRSYVFRHEEINKIIKQTTTPIIQNGKLEGLLTVSSDVTKEENLKARLIEKNYQLNTLLETLPLLVYMKDKVKRGFANKAIAAVMLGLIVTGAAAGAVKTPVLNNRADSRVVATVNTNKNISYTKSGYESIRSFLRTGKFFI